MTASTIGSNELQQIYTIGEPKNNIVIRFEKGDTEVLIIGDDSDGAQTRVWLKKKDIEDMKLVVDKILQSIVS